MDKPNLVADVHSILRRSLPDATQTNDMAPMRHQETHKTPARELDDLSAIALSRTADLMNMLQMATALSRLLPGVQFVLTNPPATEASERVEPTVSPSEHAIPTRIQHRAEVGTVRAGMENAFPESVPAAMEKILSELGVIERQDRSYYFSRSHALDAITAWAYRQRRREDILAEIGDLKASADLD